MPFVVPLTDAERQYPQFRFVSVLTPSEQKCAFHVQDANGRDLCLKIISPSSDVARVHREIAALQQISHPNVVPLVEYTYSTTPGGQVHHIIEDFIDGTDLTALLTGSAWDCKRAAGFFAALADGLGALETQSVVHRDLKPGNIRVRHDGTPVIIDLGLARHLSKTDLTRTASGAAIGTPLYFAPEQFEGTKRDIDSRTDLFAFGVLVYEALIGQHPFMRTGMTYAELSEAVRNSVDHLARPEFRNLPKNWQLLIIKLLEKDRGRRPNRADMVARILRKLEAES